MMFQNNVSDTLRRHIATSLKRNEKRRKQKYYSCTVVQNQKSFF